MKISGEMLEEKRKLYQSLQKEYADIHYREELYRVAIGLAKHSVSVVDIQKHSLVKTRNQRAWVGGTGDVDNVPEAIIAEGGIHKDSVEDYRELFRQIYAGTPAGSCIIRVKDQNDGWFWLNVSYKTLYDKDGTATHAVCYSEDITKKRDAEQMFQQFMKIVDGRSDYSYQINLTQDKVMQYNEDSLHQVGVEAGMSYTDVHNLAVDNVLEKDKQKIKEQFGRMGLLQKFYEGIREVVEQYEYRWEGSDEPVWLEAHIYMLMNTDGDVCAILSTHNIEEEKLNEEEKTRRARTDQLCSVLKRDVFQQELISLMLAKKPHYLLMMDVDKFKSVNDSYGHGFGDEVLIGVSETIKNHFRRTDLVARYGGDEFCVLMTGDFPCQVLENSTRLLLEKIRNLNFTKDYHASISIGAAKWNGTDTAQELFAKADHQLYEAKKVRGCCSIRKEEKQE